MFGVGAPGACVEHVSSSLVSYLCLRPFQANGGGMKLSPEIARTKKNVVVFFLSVSSMQTDKKKNWNRSGRNDSMHQSRKEVSLFFSLIQELRHTCMHQQRHTFWISRNPLFPEKQCQYLFSIHKTIIILGGNCLVSVYHIAPNKAAENEVKVSNWQRTAEHSLAFK